MRFNPTLCWVFSHVTNQEKKRSEAFLYTFIHVTYVLLMINVLCKKQFLLLVHAHYHEMFSFGNKKKICILICIYQNGKTNCDILNCKFSWWHVVRCLFYLIFFLFLFLFVKLVRWLEHRGANGLGAMRFV